MEWLRRLWLAFFCMHPRSIVVRVSRPTPMAQGRTIWQCLDCEERFDEQWNAEEIGQTRTR